MTSSLIEKSVLQIDNENNLRRYLKLIFRGKNGIINVWHLKISELAMRFNTTESEALEIFNELKRQTLFGSPN